MIKMHSIGDKDFMIFTPFVMSPLLLVLYPFYLIPCLRSKVNLLMNTVSYVLAFTIPMFIYSFVIEMVLSVVFYLK
jgi:hypothetical protein